MPLPPNQRIFMTGAHGYVGSSITRMAIASGHTVRGLSRNPSSDAKLLALGAVPVRGDLTSLSILRDESAAADIVIHLADPFNYDLSNGYGHVVQAQAAIADAFAEGMAGSGKPLVMTSGTLMAKPDANGAETDETAPYPENAIVPRHLIEQYDLSLAKKGIRVSSIRLAPYVYGRGGSGIRIFMQLAAAKGELIVVDGGKSVTSTVHVDDAARLYLLAAEKAPAGSVYNATNATDVTNFQLAEAISEVMNIPLKHHTLAEASEKLGSFFATFLNAPCRASSAKAKRELGWEIKEKVGVLEEIKQGSYVAAAKEILSNPSPAPAH
ncbi:putative NAD dependent epimerase/dehydratase [Annulohypoxylon maeteangense]|uniref:putative NAD dependent epimerase/dehydratase n=1 Tax=Annulohypoxylon maeteangense TaxID=1927788 RepID=UPI002008533A|nr:putative NAD dependent epimerase/dehydratase [Annulohypoxylon maeteangense]KAI0880480.1 putative NAD dependent epimerase/dehydratase [Annulohypoxylon maeteangense]